MAKSNLKIPLREQANASDYIKTHGYQTKIFLREPISICDYAEGKGPLDHQETQELGLQEISIQLSESVRELLVLFEDVHIHVRDALTDLSLPGPGNIEHLKHTHNLAGHKLMQIIRRYEDFKYKRGV